MKTCSRCKLPKALEDFPMTRRSKDGRGNWCKKCVSKNGYEARAAKREGTWIDGRSLRRKTADEKRENRQKWIEKNRENLSAYMSNYRAHNKARINAKKRETLERAKDEGILAYGGKCACCGETTKEFLTIDHINGRDSEPYRITGTKLWGRLRRLGWPKENHQLLCYNCNCAKGVYGECPHKTKGGAS